MTRNGLRRGACRFQPGCLPAQPLAEDRPPSHRLETLPEHARRGRCDAPVSRRRDGWRLAAAHCIAQRVYRTAEVMSTWSSKTSTSTAVRNADTWVNVCEVLACSPGEVFRAQPMGPTTARLRQNAVTCQRCIDSPYLWAIPHVPVVVRQPLFQDRPSVSRRVSSITTALDSMRRMRPQFRPMSISSVTA